MAEHRRVAVCVGLINAGDWRQEMFAGIKRFERESGRWECVVDGSPAETIEQSEDAPCYDGILARSGPMLASAAEANGIPLVNLSYRLQELGDVPSVVPDFAAVGRLCAEHLLGRGFRDLNCFSPETGPPFKDMADAFASTVIEAGCRVKSTTHPNAWARSTPESVRVSKSINAWLDTLSRPTALFVLSPHVAMRMLLSRAARDWRVPQDVGILCGTDDVAICEHTTPTLTSVDKNYERVGYEAAQLLDRLMDGDNPPELHIQVPPRGIVPRNSTDFFSVGDETVTEALRFIANNLHRSIDVNTLVTTLNTSRSRLSRAFRKHVGSPISEEIRRLRLEKAKRLLTDKLQRGLAAIAAETGFRDATTLCRVFRREFGVTPTQYRAQVLTNTSQAKDEVPPFLGR